MYWTKASFSKCRQKASAFIPLDSICKNVGQIYINSSLKTLSQLLRCLRESGRKDKISLYKLRQTWSSIFRPRKLYAIDHRIHNTLDPAWPITAPNLISMHSPDPKASHKTKPLLQSVVKQSNHLKTPSDQSQQKREVHITLSSSMTLTFIPPFGTGGRVGQTVDPKAERIITITETKTWIWNVERKEKTRRTCRALQVNNTYTLTYSFNQLLFKLNLNLNKVFI